MLALVAARLKHLYDFEEPTRLLVSVEPAAVVVEHLLAWIGDFSTTARALGPGIAAAFEKIHAEFREVDRIHAMSPAMIRKTGDMWAVLLRAGQSLTCLLELNTRGLQ